MIDPFIDCYGSMVIFTSLFSDFLVSLYSTIRDSWFNLMDDFKANPVSIWLNQFTGISMKLSIAIEPTLLLWSEL